MAGIVGLVGGDHIRIGRVDRLAELRPELVLLTLLPYLGFSEAQRWANQMANSSSPEALTDWSVSVLIRKTALPAAQSLPLARGSWTRLGPPVRPWTASVS